MQPCSRWWTFRISLKNKSKKAPSLKQNAGKMWIKTTKQKMLWKKQQNLSSFLREKTWVLATTHFASQDALFCCVAQIIHVDFFEKRAAFRNNHCCNFQKFCCEVCRKHSLLQCSALRVSCCVGYHRIFNKNNDNDKNIDNGNDNDKKGSNSF